MYKSNEHTRKRHWGLLTVATLLTLAMGLATPLLSQVIADPPSDAAGASASLSWSHTVGTGSSRLLLVGVSIRRANRTVTSVTYAGTGLSRVGFQNSAGNTARIELWYLLDPPSPGQAAVTVTLSGSADVAAGAVSFSGVDQSAPLGSFSSAAGTGIYGSVSVPSAVSELVMDIVAVPGTGLALTPDAGQGTNWNSGTGTAGNNVRGASSNKIGAASVAMGWTLGASNDWAIGGVSIKPTPNPNMVLTMGQDISNPSPGTTVVYTINYMNNGVGQAGSALIAFSPPVNTTLVANSVVLNGTAKTDAADTDEVTLTGSTITVNLGPVPSGAGGTLNYQVMIQ